MEQLCVACCTATSSKERRNLSGPTATHILPLFKELVEDCYPNPVDKLNFLQHHSVSRCILVCKKCFRQLERLVSIKKEKEQLKNNITAGISKVGQQFGILASTSNIQTPVKRPTEDDCGSPCKRRRLNYETPEREALATIVNPRTPVVSVLVKNQHVARVFRLSRSLKRLGRSVGRCNRRSIARQAVHDQRICVQVMKYLGQKITKEMKKMCAKSTDSVLRSKNFQGFQLASVTMEMEEHAPITLSLLRSCLAGCRLPKATNQKNKGRTKSRTMHPDRVVGICSAILLRGRSQRMNVLQHIVSMILFCGHASKRVYTRLQKLLLCVSHKTTISATESMGLEYDAEVRNWKQDILGVMQDSSIECSVTDSDSTKEDEDNVLMEDTECAGTNQESHSSSSSENLSFSPISPVILPIVSDSETATSVESQLQSSSSLSSSNLFGFGSSRGNSLPTYKLVGDNIDKNIKPSARDMRSDHQTRSLHYFHAYGVRDRIDVSQFEDSPSLPNLKDINIQDILPSESDKDDICSNFRVLIARILRKYMAFFKTFGKGAAKRIRHEYSCEMGKKSEITPLGVIFESETSNMGMVAIMEALHNYVPVQSELIEVQCQNSDESTILTKDDFHYILMGGDQLTVARARSSKRIRSNSLRPLDRLDGLIPVCEDWHAKGCLISAIWKQYYNTSSGRDGGTLFQLRNLINRRNVIKKPMDNLDACEDFIVLVTEAHILSAAMTAFDMDSLDDRPSTAFFPDGSERLTSAQQTKLFLLAASHLVDTFVDVTIPSGNSSAVQLPPQDGIYTHACGILSNGLLLLELKDAIREGDGNRIIRCWRYMLLIYKATGRKNYATEALNTLLQLRYFFSLRMAAQLKWSRTINVHGQEAKNIPADLYMEHLNKECKTILAGMGSNITEDSILRVSRALKPLMSIMSSFDKHNAVARESGAHSVKSNATDVEKLVGQLFNITKVFIESPQRTHKQFKKDSSNVMLKLKYMDIKLWIEERARSLLTYH